MAAALQTHYNELQEYLYAWNDKQQRLLEIMSLSQVMPTNSFASAKAQIVADSAREENSHAIAKGSDGVVCHDILPNSDSHAGAKSKEPEQSEIKTAQLVSQRDDDNDQPLEQFRSKLVKQFEVSLKSLKEQAHPTRNCVLFWLSATLDGLEDQITQVDLLSLPDSKESAPLVTKALSFYSDHYKMDGWNQKLGGIRQRVGMFLASLEGVSAAVIIVNAITMGISADVGMRNPEAPQKSVLKALELVFAIYYTIEIILRIFYNIKLFFVGPDCYWNLFDVGLVLSSGVDHVIPLLVVSDDSPIQNMSFLRLARLVKMLRLLRMIRLMKVFRHLRLILASILGSMQAMFWAITLMFLITYMAGVLFLNVLVNFLSDAAAQRSDVSSAVRQSIDKFWNSVSTAMISLFGATTGGADWFKVAEPLSEAGWASYASFVLYIIFFLVVVLNTFSSLFVQTVMENKEKDDQALIDAEMHKIQSYVDKLKNFFVEIDEDNDGGISMEEFVRHAEDPRILAWASSLDIDLSDAKHLFEILSHNGSINVDFESFVEGCVKMRGQAKCIDLLNVLQLSQRINDRVDECRLMLRSTKRQVGLVQKAHEEIAILKHTCSRTLTCIVRIQKDMVKYFPPCKIEL